MAVSLVAHKAEASAGTLKNPPSVGVNALADKTSKKSTTVANKGAVERVAAKAPKPRTTGPKSQSRKVRKPILLAGGNPQIAKADGDARPGLHRGHAGLKRDVGRRLDALIVRTVPDCARQSSGTRPSMALRAARAGSSTFIALRSTSKSLSSAARRSILFPPASPSTRRCATSISTRTTNSTKLSSPVG